jgi:hypothetical protein
MNISPARESDANLKWGYAFAGLIALGFAALIQVAFHGLDEETLANMPAAVTVPYGFAGKLGITIPLALLGLGLIVRDGLANLRDTSGSIERVVRPRREIAPAPGLAAATHAEELLEEGEPIPDQPPGQVGSAKPARKIAALTAGFEGRAAGAPARTGGPVSSSDPVPQRPGSGQIALSSAKYLNKNPGGSFRKGTTNNTTDE